MLHRLKEERAGGSDDEDDDGGSGAAGDDLEGPHVVGKLVMWTALIAVCSAAHLSVWHCKPPPRLGSVTMDVVREAQRQR